MKALIYFTLFISFLLCLGTLHAQTSMNSYHFKSVNHPTPENVKGMMDEIRSEIATPVQLNYNPTSGEFCILSAAPIDISNVFKSLENTTFHMVDADSPLDAGVSSPSPHSDQEVIKRYNASKTASTGGLPLIIMTQQEYDNIPATRKQQMLLKWQIDIQ
ncbi:MAG: hypothetical protein ACJAU0_001084 [Flavobacteriales bacterium]|jgi:hypothetical protein